MTRAGKKVWVRDPARANDDVFVKGLVISEDATQVRAAITLCTLSEVLCRGKVQYVLSANR